MPSSLSLASFFGANTRISAWCIDKCDDRHAKLGGEPHFLHRFAIAFRMGATKVACRAFLGGLALLMPDDQHFATVDLCKAGAHGAIVAEKLVAVQFDELVEDERQIIGCHRPLRMPRDFYGFPRFETAVDLARECGDLALEFANLLMGFRGLVFDGLELSETRLLIAKWLFKTETEFGARHGNVPNRYAKCNPSSLRIPNLFPNPKPRLAKAGLLAGGFRIGFRGARRALEDRLLRHLHDKLP